MFTLSLVHLECVHYTSPVHCKVGLRFVVVHLRFRILQLSNDDHLTMMYIRVLVRMIVL